MNDEAHAQSGAVAEAPRDARDASAAAVSAARAPSKGSRVFAQVRAVLVLGHVLAISIAAVPGPDGGMSRDQWRDPAVQAELITWSQRFHMTQERFTDLIYPLAETLFSLRIAARKPVGPYLEYTGVEQPWRLFVAPDRVPSRFQLQVLRRGHRDEETLYEEGSREYAWHRRYFTHSRTRRALYWYGWPLTWGSRGEHCEWLARQVFDEMPDAERVRCRFFRGPSPSPEQARRGAPREGTWQGDTFVTRRREAARVPGAR